MRYVIPGLFVALSACATSAKRADTQRVMDEQAAQEVARVCALEGEEREAALRKIKEESGFEVYCGGTAQ